MGTIRARDAAALLGYGFLELSGVSFGCFLLGKKNLWDVLGVVSVLTTKHASG